MMVSKRVFITVVFLLELLVLPVSVSPVFAGADANDCVQQDYRQVCPIQVDPNLLAIGPLIAPAGFDPNDPNNVESWTIEWGKTNRLLLPCDPDGDPTVVELVATNSTQANVVTNSDDDVVLVAFCAPGLAWWHLRVTDIPIGSTPRSTDVVMVADVRPRPNNQPGLN
jgi:hypothetical protein